MKKFFLLFLLVPSLTQASWWFDVDFLYWKTTVDHLPIVNEVTIVGEANDFSESLKSVNFGFDPGVRLAAGWEFPCESSVILEWTHLNAQGKKSFAAPNDGNILAPVFFVFPIPTLAIQAIQFSDYDTVSLNFHKRFALRPRMEFIPFFGAMFARLEQQVHLENLLDIDTTPIQRGRLDNDFIGGGLDLGLEMDYAFNIATVFAKGSYALLYGKFDLQQHFDVVGLPFSHRQFSSERGVVGSFDILAGIRRCWTFCNFEIEGHIAYEFVLWPKQVRLHQIVVAGDSGSVFAVPILGAGDVGYNGLTAGVGCRF